MLAGLDMKRVKMVYVKVHQPTSYNFQIKNPCYNFYVRTPSFITYVREASNSKFHYYLLKLKHMSEVFSCLCSHL